MKIYILMKIKMAKKNMNIIQMQLKVTKLKNNEKLQNILNKTFSQLDQDYINSDEFKVNEINRL